jgi:hypothetical protein
MEARTMKEYLLVQRGKAGWHALVMGGSSSGGTFAHYVANAVEGAVIIDSNDIPIDTVATLAISGPIPSQELPARTIQRLLSQPETVEAIPNNLKSLDKVSLDIYVDIYREFGAKIGRVVGGDAVWE